MDLSKQKEFRGELPIADQVAQWLEVLPTATVKQRADFLQWLRKSPLHVREILLADAFDQTLAQLDPEHRIDLDELKTRAARSNVAALRPRWTIAHAVSFKTQRRWAWAAGLAAVALISGLLWLGQSTRWWWQQRYTTVVGEQRTVQLADGSLIYLNTHSEVRVLLTSQRRDVELISGQALFTVARDAARPFRVHVDGTLIRALGTQFDVYRRAGRTTVSVIEGAVQIDAEPSAAETMAPAMATHAAPGPPARLVAGEAATVAANGEITSRAPADVVQVTAWRQRRLVFRATPLQEIAQEFNRYNRLQIRVEGDARRLQFWGVFDADNPESLVRSLEDNAGGSEALSFDRRGADELVIRVGR